ncbi:Conserved_hypothetical protein [Hexamita inflata]|uniref:Uncharacterized protein n=1 Tax=Hexamita inflata TaxID=28002 RepID=A0AA86RFF0_9EUKA|nr:Conserved hypothetical protein [Hexamita inflata]
MDQLQILDELDQIALFDEQSKGLAERIIVQMFTEVKSKVSAPAMNHYASFMVSYLKKQPELVAITVAQLVFARCSESLINSVLNQMAALVQITTKDQDMVVLLNMIHKLVDQLINAKKLNINQELIAQLCALLSQERDAIQQELSDILTLIVSTEYAHKLENSINQSMVFSTYICTEIVNNLRTNQQTQVNILKNLSVNYTTFIPILISTASSFYLNPAQVGFQLFFELLRFQILHMHSQYIHNVFQSCLDSKILELPAIYGLFKAIQANPLPTQMRLYGNITHQLLKNSEVPYQPVIANGDQIQQLISTPQQIDKFDIAIQFIQTSVNFIQLGANVHEVQKQFFTVLSIVYQQDEVVFTTQGYQEFLKQIQFMMNLHTHSEKLLFAFKAIADQFQRLNGRDFIFVPICNYIVQEFEYFKMQSHQIQHVIEHFLSQMSFQQAFDTFQVTLSSNLWIVNQISRCCVRSSFLEFWHTIVLQNIKQVMEAECDESLKNTMVNQLFQIIETCGREIEFLEYTSSNLAQISLKFTEMMNNYLRQQICDPMSLYVLKFLSMYLEHFQVRIKINDQELKHNPQKIASRISFKVFVQQYLVPQLMPCLMTLAMNEQHESFQYIIESLGGLINSIINQCVQILQNTVVFERFFVSQEQMNAIPLEIQQSIIPPSQTFNGQKLIQTAGANVIKRIVSFQNQTKELKHQTLELLITMMDTDQQILGEQTIPILRNICSQLLTNQNYVDIQNKSYKLLGKYSKYDYAGAFELFNQNTHNLKNRALFMQNLHFSTAEQFMTIWPEVRKNLIAENSKAREVAFQMVDKLTNVLEGESFNSYLIELVQQIVNFDLSQNLKELQSLLIEATLVLFKHGLKMREQLTDEFINHLIQNRLQLPQINDNFHILAAHVIKLTQKVVDEKLPLMKQTLNYIEIYTTNADSSSLTDFYTVHYQYLYLLFNNNKLSHLRIQLKRILTATGLCCGRDFVSELMSQIDVGLQNELLKTEELRQMPFADRQKCLSGLMHSSRNIFQRVNKLLRKVKPDSSFARYEAAQYLIVHETIPKELMGQLKGRAQADEEVMDLMKLLQQTKNSEGGVEEIDKLIQEAESQFQTHKEQTEEDLLLQNVKMTQQSQKESIYTNILEELNKIKQRRLYKIDARFQKTGKELQNKRGGGDLGDNPNAILPIVNSKSHKRMPRQNMKKYKEGLDVIFGKEKSKLAKNVNVYKLGRMASRAVQGGKQKVRAIKKRHEATKAATNVKGKERVQKKK